MSEKENKNAFTPDINHRSMKDSLKNPLPQSKSGQEISYDNPVFHFAMACPSGLPILFPKFPI